MAAKKQVVTLDSTLLPAMDEYIALGEEIKALETRRDALKTQYKEIVGKFFDPELAYQCGRLNFAARYTLEIDQLATFTAFANKAKREMLFPGAIQFKGGEAKEVVVAEGLGKLVAGEPVITVKK